jgi:hypothetical protein
LVTYKNYFTLLTELRMSPTPTLNVYLFEGSIPIIVYIITKYKITHYQYPILHNREFRSLGNRKNYLKSTAATLQSSDVRIYLCLRGTIIFAIIRFLSEIFFPCTVASNKFWSSMSFQNLVRLSQI